MYIGVSLISFILVACELFYSISYIEKIKSVSLKYEWMNLFLIGAIVSKINIATISINLLGTVINFIITPVVAQWTIIYLEMRVLNDIDIANDYSYNFDLE